MTTRTDVAGVTCKEAAIVGNATLAMAASSTTSAIASSTAATATPRRGRGTPESASAIAGSEASARAFMD
ncbi:MAG TPA: hypothetical protein VFL62_17800 [Bradyrhizobium sp.]|uniref:hypothetical protein n=1 Tax=Bradyrhizobium sp. TaxID=376 RepID=UPI002D805EE2|nr:hypothetical protein [Bradyrhizobium sp.]HET7888082.1 hypothetical protein [Bradyrhizobium sp.]